MNPCFSSACLGFRVLDFQQPSSSRKLVVIELGATGSLSKIFSEESRTLVLTQGSRPSSDR